MKVLSFWHCQSFPKIRTCVAGILFGNDSVCSINQGRWSHIRIFAISVPQYVSYFRNNMQSNAKSQTLSKTQGNNSQDVSCTQNNCPQIQPNQPHLWVSICSINRHICHQHYSIQQPVLQKYRHFLAKYNYNVLTISVNTYVTFRYSDTQNEHVHKPTSTFLVLTSQFNTKEDQRNYWDYITQN